MSAEPSWEREQRRETPNNIESEQAVLGAILVNNEAFYGVSDFLRSGHFFEPLHRKIYDVASELIRMGKMASPVTIKSFLPADEKVGEDMTVARYLARLAASAVTIINTPDYGRSIFDLATRRGLISAGQDLIDIAYDAPVEMSPQEIGEAHMGKVSEVIAPEVEFIGAVSFETALTSAIDSANVAYMADGEQSVAGCSYGFPPLERLIGPIFPGQLVIIGGPSKAGKSSLAAQIAFGAARRGHPVWFYSAEMTAAELAMREISRDTKLPVWKQRRGQLHETEFVSMIDFAKANGKLPVVIQNRRLTLSGIRERARNFKRKRAGQKNPIVVIDYIGLVEKDKQHQRMSHWEFGEEVTREAKAIARDLDVPVIAVAQLKKNTFAEAKPAPVTEKSLDAIVRRRPRASDLVGAIERDADHVVIPFRPEVILAEHEPTPGTDVYGMWESKMNFWRGKAELVLALSRERHWPKVEACGWDGSTTTFFETGGEEQRYGDPEFIGNPLKLF